MVNMLNTSSANGGEFQHPVLSVVMPVYNSAKHLAECLDSVCNQTYRYLEIICVDDGSTDGSARILDDYAGRDPRIVVFHRENEGPSSARNLALDHAHGTFVIGLDSDDVLLPNCYERALSYMTDEVDMVCFGVHVFGEDSRQVSRVANSKSLKIEKEELIPLTGEKDGIVTGYAWNKIFRRKIIEQYNIRYPEGVIWCEDVVFSQKYASVARNVYMLPEKLYRYRIHGASITGMARADNRANIMIFTPISMVYDWYHKRGIWDQYLPTVEHWANYVLWILKFIPRPHKLKAKIKFCCWVHQWGLSRYFPDNEVLQLYGDLGVIDVLQRYVEEIVKEAERARQASCQPFISEEENSFSFCYGLSRNLPIFVVKNSKDVKTGRKEVRVQLFGIVPFLLGKGSSNRMHWKLFYVIPVWRVEKLP